MLKTRVAVLLAQLRATDGATAVEYALVASLIALVVLGAVTLIGIQVQGFFSDFVTGMGWG